MAKKFSLGTTILVVDDEDQIRTNTHKMLEMLGATVVCAEDGLVAKEKILERRGPFDVVLTDMQMPGMDGLELTAWMKVAAPETPVILWTGRPTLAEGHEADLLIGKPASFAEIIESFARLIPHCFEKIASSEKVAP
jgi:CheY-like chemotaxis protein